ncbi:MAG: hypothetical protein ABJ176_07865 [Anderseniella sp.]
MALIVFILIWRASGLPLRELLFEGLCATLLLTAFFIAVLFLLVRALELRFCPSRHNLESCRRDILILSSLLLLLLLGALLLVRQCPEDLRQKDFDLAMTGIHWDGKYAGESGAHLRWGFRYGLTFPQEGFDLYRRPSSGGSWTLLNTSGRIHPAQVWSGPVPGPGTLWQGRGSDRLPSVLHPRYQGANAENFQLLREMLQHDPYQPLYYVEGNDQPFLTEADAKAAADIAPEQPAARWEIEPMTLMLTMALHSEVARLLGLYFIDKTADANVEYDYRVFGYWDDATRSYTVRGLNRSNSEPIEPPQLERATSIPGPNRTLPDGTYWPTEATVGLRWSPPTSAPDIDLTKADGLKPVFYLPYRRDLGPAIGNPLPSPDDFAVISEATDASGFQQIDPIAPNPRELKNNPGQFVWPEYFAYDNWVDYRLYEYCIAGLDLFGRESPCSNALQVTVTDEFGPPPPTNVEALIFQRSDPATERLLPALRDALFPAGSSNEFAVRVSWLWPDEVRKRVRDMKAFQVHYKFQDFANFSSASRRSDWPLVANWDGILGLPVGGGDARPDLPLRFQKPDGSGDLLVPASSYYEVIVRDLPSPLIPQLTADDDTPVVYGFFTVVTVDHSPFNNVGAAGPPAIAFTRDFTPPDPPMTPEQLRAPSGLDKAGNAKLELRVPGADERYTYQFFKIRSKMLEPLPDATAAWPAACAADTDADKFELQRRAAENSDRLGQASATPVKPRELSSSVWVSDFNDVVDGTISQHFFYAARAIDPAGNPSKLSCPSVSVASLDRMAPRTPVLTSILGAEGGIELSWSENAEDDLQSYEIYRTSEPGRLNSKRKMQLVFVADEGGNSVRTDLSPTDATVFEVGGDRRLRWIDNGVHAGRRYYYRMVARDEGENASEMSNASSASAIDTTPPPPPQWAPVDPVKPQTDPVTNAFSIALTWQATPDEPGLRYLVQRRNEQRPGWISITRWLPATTSHEDKNVVVGREYHYRLLAMDPMGNRSDPSFDAQLP